MSEELAGIFRTDLILKELIQVATEIRDELRQERERRAYQSGN